MNLSELITLHRGARSYADLERDCGGKPTRGRLQQLGSQPIKNFPDPPTVRALARGLKVSQAAVVLAAAESLGLDVRRSQPRLVELMPAGVENLTELQAAAVAHLVSTMVDPGEAGRTVAEAERSQGPEPTMREVLAAQRRQRDSWIAAHGGDVEAALEAARRSSDLTIKRMVGELEDLAAGRPNAILIIEEQEAARTGTPTLREVRRAQDEAGEAPDPEGPEGGA